MPERIQLRRTKGWRKPEGAISVARPSRWGNPYKVGMVTADPVNSMNPVAATSVLAPPARASLPREFERESWTGTVWVQRYYVVESAAQAVALYRRLVEFEGYNLDPLRGHDLACWCPLEDAAGRRVPCHADVLLELANPGWTA